MFLPLEWILNLRASQHSVQHVKIEVQNCAFFVILVLLLLTVGGCEGQPLSSKFILKVKTQMSWPKERVQIKSRQLTNTLKNQEFSKSYSGGNIKQSHNILTSHPPWRFRASPSRRFTPRGPRPSPETWKIAWIREVPETTTRGPHRSRKNRRTRIIT